MHMIYASAQPSICIIILLTSRTLHITHANAVRTNTGNDRLVSFSKWLAINVVDRVIFPYLQYARNAKFIVL